MTMSLDAVAVQQFSDFFVNELTQTMSKLEGTTRIIRGVVGSAYVWKEAGNADMIERGAYQSDIPASDIDYTPVTTNFKNYVLKLPTDVFEQALVNADERANLALKHASAINRKKDQIIINALNASTTTNTVAAGGTNLTIAKLRSVHRLAQLNNWPQTMWHLAIHANNLYSLLGEKEVQDVNYNTIKALVNGEIDTFLNFKFHTFGDLSTGGLPLASNIRTCFAWAMDGVGVAESLAPQVTVDYDQPNRTYQSVSSMRAGASPLLNEAIVKFSCDESGVV